MNSYETLNNNNDQDWDMSDIQFAGAKKQQGIESLQKALEYAPMLLSKSAIFGDDGRPNAFTNTIMSQQPNTEILENVKALDNGRFKENYGVDYSGRGYTGLGQVSGALDYFDEEYGGLIDDSRLNGLIKTCIAAWPMGEMGNFGVREFAKSAKMDDGTAQLISMIIDRNSMVLAKERFDEGNQESGAKLLEVNKKYLTSLHDGFESGYEEKEARCVCNIQKIVMDCEKVGATIAKARKA